MPQGKKKSQQSRKRSGRGGRADARDVDASGGTLGSPKSLASDGDGTEGAAFSDAEARAALEASDKLYYRIGEVSKLTGVKAHVLRYWETEFRWMAPPKSRSKQRLYRKRDIEFVWLLKRLLWDERYTIAGARQRIQDLGVDDALALLSEPKELEGTRGSRAQASDSDEATQPDWVSFRAALGDMKSDLVSLREVLQEGL